jgi:hypothetical protein
MTFMFEQLGIIDQERHKTLKDRGLLREGNQDFDFRHGMRSLFKKSPMKISNSSYV